MQSDRQPDLFGKPAPAAPDFPLTIRPSRRARRLMLRCLPPHTLEVVVPPRARPADVQSFIAENQRWIDNARRELMHARVARDTSLPGRIDLPSLGRSWTVSYRSGPGRRAALRAGAEGLEIFGPDDQHARTPGLLRNWLREQGRAHLVPWLEREAGRLGLAPRGVQVRLQRTRWGSCSSRGVISLNAALLLLDAERVRYLMVHELCHLELMNHSPRYWRLVQRFEPDWERLDRSLGGAWAEMPWWAHPTS